MSSVDGKLVTEKSKASKDKKVKKPVASKEKNTKGSKVSSSSHPPYFQMIKEAILALYERTGSSPYAIAKYMEEKHKGELPSNFRKVLAIQLRNFTSRGKLVKVKASFKLSESGKKGETKAAKDVKSKVATNLKKPKTAVKGIKPKSATLSAPVKRKNIKKPLATAKSAKKAPEAKSVKKAAPVKPKQPKKIKSPAAKRAKKAAA
ncbi:hypothetical protein IEQ34_022009 [Dendrobium chrysotoxum]|uniref:H15 domain-containing protein n=1 Tax=Dendrobium chrysotoxum TaxID=161865 RepID=A0AAV7FWK3_DENCH|nr:hypothetical protein IEQ34_022009 [Dendrobium chrysotoxum]